LATAGARWQPPATGVSRAPTKLTPPSTRPAGSLRASRCARAVARALLSTTPVSHAPDNAVSPFPGAVPSTAASSAAAARASALRSGAPLALPPAVFRPLLSPYLDAGYKQDTVRLRQIVVTWPRATASLDVTAHAMPSNGRYHFTALHAMLCVCQVGIVVATIAHGLTAKPGEIYMRDFSIVCRREINRTRDLLLRCELARAQATPDAVLYEIGYEYCERAFTGTVRCLFPLRAPAGAA
jgi:hypothetical protein